MNGNYQQINKHIKKIVNIIITNEFIEKTRSEKNISNCKKESYIKNQGVIFFYFIKR